jgi:hypothetical protein
VPANAPSGTYTYTVAAGGFPGTVLSADSFTVVKQAASGVARGIAPEGWSVSGWEAASGLQGADVGLSVSPNPFRGEAAVSLTLLEPGEVEVALYDVLGREVALLHDGALSAGPHALALSAALPPGVYVVRVSAGGAITSRAVTLFR